MSQAFYRPSSRPRIEDFSRGFHHAPSNRHFRYVWREGQLLFQRHQRGEDGGPINALEVPVDWIIGSGNHVRTYLYQTPNGELFELPLSWYTDSASWQMSPSYDRADHEGVGRRIRQECMFCHNAYPQVPLGSDIHPVTHPFPEELPEGIGCQRCHGPGGEHVRQAHAKLVPKESIRKAIVNPAKLPAARRHEICLSCHMAPSAAVPGIRRFDRPEFSFRPGHALSDFRLPLEVVEADRNPGERFEINHHAYRLLQSPCFTASSGKLSCLTCHDVHRKVPESEREEHYGGLCLDCHNGLDFPAMHREKLAAWRKEHPRSYEETADSDCVTCHMPRRRTEDVVHATMTDHRISRIPAGEDALAPREETEPVIEDIQPLWPHQEPDPAQWDLYRTVATLRASSGAHEAALDHLERLVASSAPRELEPYLDLADAQMKLGRLANARVTLDAILKANPKQPKALESLALLEASQGDPDQALELLRQVVKLEPKWAEAYINLGRELVRQRQVEEAFEALKQALALRPNSPHAWYELGRLEMARGQWAPAVEALQRSLAWDPGLAAAYAPMADALTKLGKPEEASRYLRHGARHARETEEQADKSKGLDESGSEFQP